MPQVTEVGFPEDPADNFSNDEISLNSNHSSLLFHFRSRVQHAAQSADVSNGHEGRS